MRDYQMQLESMKDLEKQNQAMAETIDGMAVASRREIDDLKRECSQVKIKLSKALHSLEDAINEKQ